MEVNQDRVAGLNPEVESLHLPQLLIEDHFPRIVQVVLPFYGKNPYDVSVPIVSVSYALLFVSSLVPKITGLHRGSYMNVHKFFNGEKR